MIRLPPIPPPFAPNPAPSDPGPKRIWPRDGARRVTETTAKSRRDRLILLYVNAKYNILTHSLIHHVETVPNSKEAADNN